MTIQNAEQKTAADIVYDYRIKLTDTKYASYLHDLELILTSSS